MQTLIANRYRILEEIGKGRASTVYRALDTENEQVVALKIPTRQAVPGEKSPRLPSRSHSVPGRDGASEYCSHSWSWDA